MIRTINLRVEKEQGRHQSVVVFINGQFSGRLILVEDELEGLHGALKEGLPDAHVVWTTMEEHEAQ